MTRKEYAYTTAATPGGTYTTVTYTYTGDKLTGYTGQSGTGKFQYDEIGNPTKYKGLPLEWHGRQLISYGSNSYTYNAKGIRTSKTVGSIIYKYDLDGTRVVKMSWGADSAEYYYDEQGRPSAMKLNGDFYFFEHNFQGDIIGVYNVNGTRVLAFTYDAWGRVLSTTGTAKNTIVETASIFRYRGYIYDQETQLYYLQSRYYDSQTMRFINSDSYVSTGQGLVGNNMYVYCGNNPVSRIDPSGYFWKEIKDWFVNVGNNINEWFDETGEWLNNNALNYDGTYSLHDNKRFSPKERYHEQILVLEGEKPQFDLINKKLYLGTSITLITGGWEGENWDLSLLDFGKVDFEAYLDFKNWNGAAVLGCSVWSPSYTFDAFGGNLTIGANILGFKKGIEFGDKKGLYLGVFNISYSVGR